MRTFLPHALCPPPEEGKTLGQVSQSLPLLGGLSLALLSKVKTKT